MLLPNHINCPSVKLIGATLSIPGDIKALDAINFCSKFSDLPGNLPDFLSDTCKHPGIRVPKVLIGRRFDWVCVGHGAHQRGAEQARGPTKATSGARSGCAALGGPALQSQELRV